MAEIRICSRFYACPGNLQVQRKCDQNWLRYALDEVKYGVLSTQG